MDRAYTVKEIDALRKLCVDKWLFGSFFPYFQPLKPILGFDGNIIGYSGGSSFSRSYKQTEMDAGVEQLVRTYMMAGITAEDIFAQRPVAAEEGPEPNGVQK
jgi:hypothetical protein